MIRSYWIAHDRSLLESISLYAITKKRPCTSNNTPTVSLESQVDQLDLLSSSFSPLGSTLRVLKERAWACALFGQLRGGSGHIVERTAVVGHVGVKG